MGGKEAYEAHLDELFTAEAETSGRDQADITGLIGQYAHGNEPSHHMAYLYNYVGKPHKTQEKVHDILTTLYSNAPDGISGNEDCGQMSAWYVLSSLGFYPVTPASNEYIIGSPLFKKATIHFENGKSLTIKKEGEGTYVHGMSIDRERVNYGNKRPNNKSLVTHEELMAGGQWVFEMGTEPSFWGTAIQNRPKTSIETHAIVSPPFIASGDISFPGTTQVTLANISPDSKLFYALKDQKFQSYTEPFTVAESNVLRAYAVHKGVKSATVETQFYKYDADRSITLNYEYANEYSAGGNDALIDGIQGTKDFRSGAWQGIKNEDLGAFIDLGSIKTVDEISINFLKDQRSWIFYPKNISVDLLDANKKIIAQASQALPETGK